MPVFKSTVKKFMKQPSTWVITILAALILYFVVGPLALSKIDYKTVTENSYTTYTTVVYTGTTLFFALFGAMFSGFKAARTFKDEVEDGTFLITLSKPISRGRIIFEKWLALTLLNLSFILVLILSLSLAILLNEHTVSITENPEFNPDLSLKHNLWKIALVLFAIGAVIILILSSIGLMLSTKLSVGGTVGITLAIGLIIPVSGIVGQFTNKIGYTVDFVERDALSSNRVNRRLESSNITDDTVKAANILYPDLSPIINSPAFNQLPESTQNAVRQFNEANKGKKIETLEDLSAYRATLTGFIYANQDIIRLGVLNGEDVTYNNISFIDLQYQVSQLGKIARDASGTSPSDTSAFSSSFEALSARAPGSTLKLVRDRAVDNTYADQIANDLGGPTLAIEGIFDTMGQELNKVVPGASNTFNFDLNTIFNYDQLFNDIKTQISNPTDPKYQSINKDYEDGAQELTAANAALVTATGPARITALAARNAAEMKKAKATLELGAASGLLDTLKTKEFVDPYIILYVYLALALSFIPISYWIVKKQDFR
ncbi:MAG: ABC transporter permease [Mycoplasma sp.]|nr:ABC transporter permease [Mycoplasma sp.]